MEKFCRTIFGFWAVAFILIASQARSQTPGGANGMVFRFTKQVWLNPTIILAKQNFEQSTNVKLLILPRVNGDDTTGSSRIEKAFDKLLSFLVFKENVQGSIKFYFNPKNPTKPFTFNTSDELHCKFTPIQKDSVETILNKDIVNSSNLNNFTALPFDSIINRASRYCKRILQSKPGPCGENPGNEFTLTKINSTPAKLNFVKGINLNPAAPNGGVDTKKYAELEQYYNTVLDVADNSNYPLAWKAMAANASDVIKLKLKKKESYFDINKLVFKNANGTETYNVTYNNIDRDSIIDLSISGKSPGSMAEVVAFYTPTTTPTQTFAIGAFNVQFYEPKTLNVVLVNLGGAALPGANDVKDSLNRIYGGAFIKWNVTTASYNLPSGINKHIHVQSSGLLSNYMPDMQPIVSSFKDNCSSYNGSSDNTYYLLFGCTNDSDPLNKLTGYMPRARNTGFIFDTDIRTIAHELGHGAFNLNHIFSSDELGEGYKKQTDNLMDYVDASRLYKHQWDLIHNPASVGWFAGDDDEASSQTINTLAQLQPYKNPDNSFTFFSTGGTPITIPGNATNVRFSTSDNYVDLSTGERASYTPIGALLSFNIGTKYYRGRGNSTTFSHYLAGTSEQYIDSLTNKLNPGAAIVALAYYENGKVGINFLKVNYNTSGIPKNNTGVGTYGLANVTKVIDLAEGTTTALVADYSFHKVALGIKIDSIPVSPPLNFAAWKFLEDNKEMTTYSISIAPLIIAHAHQLTENPVSTICNVSFADKLMFIPPVDPYAQSEANSGQVVEIANAVFNEKVDAWRSQDLDRYWDVTKMLAPIENKILSLTTGDEVSDYIQNSTYFKKYPCLYELMSWKAREYALLKISEKSSINERVEEIIVHLTDNVVRNGQSTLVYDLMRANNNKLFFDLTRWNSWFDGLDRKDLDQFIRNMSEITIANSPPVNQSYAYSFCNGADFTNNMGQNYALSNLCFSFDYEMADGSNCSFTESYTQSGFMKITRTFSNSNGNTTIDDLFEGDPFTMLKYTLPKNNCLFEPCDGEVFYAPAFYAALMIKRKNQARSLTALRILVDGVVVVSTVASGGAASPLMVVDAVFAGTDLLVAINEETLSKSSEGQSFLTAWNNITLVGAAPGLAAFVSKATTVVSGISRANFTFKTAELLTYIKNLPSTTKNTVVERFNAMSDALGVLVTKLNRVTVENIVKANLIYKLGEVNLVSRTTTMLGNFAVKVKSNIIAVAFVLNTEYEIGNLAYMGTMDYFRIAPAAFRETGIINGQVVSRLEIQNVRYVKPGNYILKNGDLEVIIVNENGVVRAIVKEAGALLDDANSAFINGWTKQSVMAKVAELKPLNQKLSPATYLRGTYITDHLNKFKIKASYLVTGQAYDQFIVPASNVGRTDGLFISTAADIDDVLAKAKGDIAIIEQELGIPAGLWQNKGGIYRLDINNPENFNLRMADGSELGANPLWEPGGLTSGGKVEAVTNPIPKANIVSRQVVSESGGVLDNIYDTQKSVVNANKNIIASASNNAKGAFGEITTDAFLTEKGFEALHHRKTALTEGWGETGLDGVFRKNGQFYILESKYSGTATLGTTADGKQMSDTWILGGDRLMNAVGPTLRQEIINQGYTRVLAKVSPDGSIIFKELDALANEIRTFTP